MLNDIHMRDVDPNTIQRLNDAIDPDWSVAGDYETFGAWWVWRNKNVLPFAGGWFDQPRWIRKAFGDLNQMYNILYHQKDLPAMAQFNNPMESMYTLKAQDSDG